MQISDSLVHVNVAGGLERFMHFSYAVPYRDSSFEITCMEVVRA